VDEWGTQLFGWLSFEKLWVRPSAALREKVNRNEND
jgi:hypothetical protein